MALDLVKHGDTFFFLLAVRLGLFRSG